MRRLTKRLYLNADKTKVVEHDSPEAAFLLGPVGAHISEEDAERLGVSHTEEIKGTIRANANQTAYAPLDPSDDSLYDDQTDKGKEARRAARDQQQSGIYQYVKSTGGSDEDAERAAEEASGQAALQGPSSEEMQAERDALVGKSKK